MKLTDEQLEGLLRDMELESPSMSFTRNVMEQARQEISPVSLKTRIDKRIIYSIAAVFVVAIIGIIIYALTRTYLQPGVADIDRVMNKVAYSVFLNAFLFIDVVIALFYFDRFLRRGLKPREEKAI